MNILKYEGTWERIDTWLTKQFPYSRNFFHHIIERGWVRIDWKSIKKSYKLKNWEELFIDDIKRYLSPIILSEAPDIDIPIVLEKEDYLVINKPKGVLSHPNSVWEVWQASVVWFLYHRYKDLPSVGNFIRAWLIHRLDKETNGLMIIAKTEKWLAHFKKIFQEKSEAKTIEEKEEWKLKKIYRATSHITDEGKKFLNEIKNKLPYYINELVIPKVPNYEPKIWITKILNINEIKNNSELIMFEIEILTGRTHQIRYHLSKYWLPIVWDYMYGTDEGIAMQLTAYKLIFEDLDLKIIELEI